jgi:outer membrane protein TolC
LFLLFAVLTAAAGTPLEAKVTLREAVRRAWEQSPALERQLLGEEEAGVGLRFAKGQRYFRLDAGGSYRFTSDAVSVKAGDFPLLPPDLGIPENLLLLSAPNDSYDLRLTLVQPLFTGGALRQAVRMEEIRGLLERSRTALVRVELAGQVQSSFLTCRLLETKRDSMNRLAESLELHLRRVEALVREDLARRSDLLETRARIDEVRLGLADIGLQIEQERTAFIALCGLDPAEVDAGGLAPAPPPEECWAAFLKSHPLLGAFEEQERLVEAGRRAAAASRLPQLAAAYELHYGKPGLNFFKDEWKLYVQAGLTLSVPLINRSQSDRDMALAELEAGKLKSRKEEFLRDVDKSLKQLFLLKRALAAKRSLAEDLVRHADEDVRLKESLHRESQLSNLDYLAAAVAAEKYRSLREEIDVHIMLADVRIRALVGLSGAEQ